jgi:hypothetical protein
MSDSESDVEENIFFDEEYNKLFKDLNTEYEEYKHLEEKNLVFDYKHLVDSKNTSEYISYNIPFLNTLHSIDILQNVVKECYFIPYVVVKDAVLPYLLFFFIKTDFYLSFMPSYLEDKLDEMSTFLPLHLPYLKEENIRIKGFQEKDDKYYIYVELDVYQPLLITPNDYIYPITLHEIIHHHYCLNIPIDTNSILFFEKKINFFLLEYKDTKIEIPLVVYNNNPIKKCEFYSIFGIPKTFDIIPNEYTFFPLENISKQENGLNRSVIFCGSQNIVNIQDIDNNTILHSDSLLIIGNVQHKYIWVVKEYLQQSQLSYHYVKDFIR